MFSIVCGGVNSEKKLPHITFSGISIAKPMAAESISGRGSKEKLGVPDHESLLKPLKGSLQVSTYFAIIRNLLLLATGKAHFGLFRK